MSDPISITTHGSDNGEPFVGPSPLDQPTHYPLTWWEVPVAIILMLVIMATVWQGWGVLMLVMFGVIAALLFVVKSRVAFWALVAMIPIATLLYVLLVYQVRR
jgi:hypothetical protein